MSYKSEKGAATIKHCENMRPGSSVPYSAEFKEAWECMVSFEQGYDNGVFESSLVNQLVLALKKIEYVAQAHVDSFMIAPMQTGTQVLREWQPVLTALKLYEQAKKEAGLE